MLKLGLIGKDISHSASPHIYKGILKEQLDNYLLLDISETVNLPNVEELLDHLDGISVTAPYKRWAYLQISVPSKIADLLGYVNAIYRKNGKIHGDLTDYYGAKIILQREINNRGTSQVAILGDGAMAHMCCLILKELSIPYRIFSRKLGWSGVTDYSEFFINTCLRSSSFPFVLPEKSFLWDLNYGYICPLLHNEVQYLDGLELLHLQAEYFLQLIFAK